MTNSFIGDAWRSICMFIDSVLYNLVALLYRLFYLVANSEFLKNSTVVKDVYSRVSLFLGILCYLVYRYRLLICWLIQIK